MNLSVPPGMLDDQRTFLVHALGYAPLPAPEALLRQGITPHWFEGPDGSQVHIGEDPDHVVAARAHVALEFDEEELAAVERRVQQLGVDYRVSEGFAGLPRQILLRDPGGNLWELRGPD